VAIDDAEIEQQLLAGKTIQAMKRYREMTGATLSEARSAVVEKQRQLRLSGALPPPRPVRLQDVLALCIVIAAFTVIGFVAVALKHAAW